jgi:pimeloyl-ACP methyl ester carboxylesterase
MTVRVAIALAISWVSIVAGAQQRVLPLIREAHASLPGVRLFYRDTGGSGQAVVFMHPATGTSQVWENQLAAFARAGYRAIAIDRRGWGRTEIDPAGPQPGTAADDLLALMNQLGIQQFHLVGSAAGGFVTFDFALSYPDRLRSFVVANSIGGVQDDEFVKLGAELRPAEFLAMPAHLRELSPNYRAADPEGTRRWLEIERGSRSGGPASAEATAGRAGEARAPGAARGNPTPAQPLKNRLTFAALETIMRPALLMTGGADMYAPPPVTRMFVQHIKRAEFLVIPDAGHAASWEQPDAFNRAVLAFLKKH